MSSIFTLFLLILVSLSVGKLINKNALDVFPAVMMSVILILFPFYCLNLLFIGRITIYLVSALLIAAAAYRIYKSGLTNIRLHRWTSAPGLLIFSAVCVFFVFFMANTYVALWDELRLWGAVPKALFYTEQLQLGRNALIFPVMQSYPPGMALFVYFMTALSKDFPEAQIFWAYAIFVSALFLPSLKNLKWKQWPLFVPFAMFIIFFPCLFTSHGGDYGYFYRSLFIDPVLGIAIGYTFYLSVNKPFDSRFNLWKFCSAIGILILLKDSGAAFAIIIFLNALILQLLSDRKAEKKQTKSRWMQYGLVLFIFCVCFFGWKMLIAHYNIVNHLSMSTLPNLSFIEALIEQLLTIPAVHLNFANIGVSLQLSILAVIVILTIGTIVLTCKYRDISIAENSTTLLLMFLSFIIFWLGMCSIFVDSFPSLARYSSTLIFCLATYFALRIIPILIEKCTFDTCSWKKSFAILCVSFSVIYLAVPFFQTWSAQNDFSDIKKNAKSLSNVLLAQLPEEDKVDRVNVYLLLSKEYFEGSQLHHRVFYDLLGSPAIVRNYYKDARIALPDQICDPKDLPAVKQITQEWCDRLIKGHYDYVYVASVDDFTTAAFNELPNHPVPNSYQLYKIIPAGDSITLTPCEA